MMRTNERLIGAAAERKAILRKVRLEIRSCEDATVLGRGDIEMLKATLAVIERWILDRDRRYKKRKGGL